VVRGLGSGYAIPQRRIQSHGDEIKRFAAEFDPQPFHLDEAEAEKSIFAGLAASGWHTAALAMRLIVSVRPFGSNPVVELTPSRTKPQGTVRVKWVVFNQNYEEVLRFTPIVVVPRRPAS
jgi:acyl dehydratase